MTGFQPKVRKKLNVMEDTEGNVTIDGLNEVPVTNVEDITALMKFGESHRHYGETNMNERSSRSHTIFRYAAKQNSSYGYRRIG